MPEKNTTPAARDTRHHADHPRGEEAADQPALEPIMAILRQELHRLRANRRRPNALQDAKVQARLVALGATEFLKSGRRWSNRTELLEHGRTNDAGRRPARNRRHRDKFRTTKRL